MAAKKEELGEEEGEEEEEEEDGEGEEAAVNVIPFRICCN